MSGWARSFAGDWGAAGGGRAGFGLGSHGLASWPLPLPDELHFGATPSGISGDPVDSWLAQTSAKALTASGGGRPTVSAIEGLPAPLFDGSNDYLERASDLPSGSEGELWAVVRFASVASDQLIWVRHGSSAGGTSPHAVFPYLGLWLIGQQLWVFFSPAGTGATRGITGASTLAAGTYLIRVTGDGADWTLHVNGVEDAPYSIYEPANGGNSGEWLGAAGTTRFRIGLDYIDTSPLNGTYGFLMHVPGLLSDAGAAAWTRLLKGAFGIA